MRYGHPLSGFHAFCLAISVLHNPGTERLDRMGKAEMVADAREAEAAAMAMEYLGAVERGGALRDAHEKYYKPEAESLVASAVQRVTFP